MKNSFLIFCLIALVGIFFSFYSLEKLYGFEFDQERDYYIVKEIINGKLTLIGPRVVSSAGFYLGPWYYYLQLPFFFIMSGNPLYGAAFTASVNLVIYLSLYFVLHRLTSSRLIALAAAILWVSTANRSNWNVSFVPLFFLGFLYLYTRLLKKWTFIGLWLLTFTLFLSLNFHPQMIFLTPVWLYALIKHRLTLKQFLILSIAVLLPFVPLVIFDLRHDFINIRALLNFLSSSSEKNSAISGFRLAYSLRQFSTSLAILYPGFQHDLWLTGALLLITGALTLRHRNLFILWLLPVLSIFTLAFYREATWPEYYHFLGGFSLLLLVFLIAAKYRLLKIFMVVLAAYLVINNARWLFARVEPGSYFFKKAMVGYMLSENLPFEKLNIENDFRYGEGLGFLPIRQFYENAAGEYHPTLKFYVSYAGSQKHNDTKKEFGLYAISKISVPERM